MKYKILVLTDHIRHSAENSLYPLLRSMCQHPYCVQLDVGTRANQLNDSFFKQHQERALFVNRVDENFAYHPEGKAFEKGIRKEKVESYDVIWLRMPPPLSSGFLNFLAGEFPRQFIINSPKGILETGSKSFLLNFPKLCPPMKICRTIDDILEFKSRFPIVLKPFREYGGKGIVKIKDDQVWEGVERSSLDSFINKIKDTEIEYLGVKYLEKVYQGDKRIVVVNGKIIGASLRLPPSRSWLCNVAMGGTSTQTEVDEAERKMVDQVNTLLAERGVIIYGLDTLQGDDGVRVLSEINTTSIGGLPQIAKFDGRPVVEEAIELVFDYIIKKCLFSLS